jgi:hypothetical protein
LAVLTSDITLSVKNAIGWLEHALRLLQPQPKSPEEGPLSAPTSSQLHQIAFGSKVSPVFKERVLWIADSLGCQPSWLMACMAWEDAETFHSGTKNAAGSGAVGLIQFMPSTAKSLGTTTDALVAMTPEDQLRYVYQYFLPYSGRLSNLGDVYMAILWPKAVGKTDDYVIFDRSSAPTAFKQNAGLDGNRNGLVTRGECVSRVSDKLTKGLSVGYLG